MVAGGASVPPATILWCEMDELDRQAIARGDCGVIDPERSEADVQAEMTERGHKAGYMTKYGECPRASRFMVSGFGKSKLNVWPRDANGRLIE